MYPKENAAGETPKRKKWVWLTVPIVLITVIVLGFSFVPNILAEQREAKGEIPLQDVKRTTLKSFTVNLRDASYQRYLRTTITLEYSSKELEEEIAVKLHRINDVVLTSLRNKKISYFTSPENTDKLRQELLRMINSQLDKGEINGLFFEDFIIQ